jgi:hypothetical protein
VANREVVLSNNVSAESHTFRWRVNKGKSKLNHSQLNTLSRRHIVQKTVSGVRSLHINLTLELDGLAAGFQFQRVKDGQLTTTPSNWVVLKVSTPVKISLGQNSIYTAQNGQNISICANISGNPLPQATVVWKQTEAMLNESLHRYDGNCWTLDKSVVKKGGNFMIVARNCLDRTNASFSIIGEGKTVSSTAHPDLRNNGHTTKVLVLSTSHLTTEASTRVYQTPMDKGTINSSGKTNTPVWIYIVIAVGIVSVLVVLIILLFMKFRKKERNYSEPHKSASTRSHSWIGNSYKLAHPVRPDAIYDQPDDAFHKEKDSFANNPQITRETSFYDKVAADEAGSEDSNSENNGQVRYEIVSDTEETKDETEGPYSYVSVHVPLKPLKRERKVGSAFLQADLESLGKAQSQEVIKYADIGFSAEQQESRPASEVGSVQYLNVNTE